MEDRGENGRSKKMGDAQHQLLVLNHQPCAKCFSRRGTCGLAFLTIGLPGDPSLGLPPPEIKWYLGLFDRFKRRGTKVPRRWPRCQWGCLTWSEDPEVVRVLVPAALTADRCEAHEYSRCLRSQRGSLQHKRGVWVWVWVRFSRATSWSQLAAPALHTPLRGAEPPVG